jgi:hypothetical protein
VHTSEHPPFTVVVSNWSPKSGSYLYYRIVKVRTKIDPKDDGTQFHHFIDIGSEAMKVK